jgi:hypothetical protein
MSEVDRRLGSPARSFWGRLPIGERGEEAEHRAIARLMLFARRPYHLSEQEADRWMRTQAAGLVQSAAVGRVQVSRLRHPGARASDWDWLIEMHFDDAADASRAAREQACRDLVADLRLLGMRPSLVLADGTRALGA